MDSSSPFLKDFLGLTGVRVGSYVIGEIASLGGVALVYRGQHESLHNAVAVKVLTPEVATAEYRDTLEQLFLREAQILSQLRSEHILRAHDVGKVTCPADGRERPYMVVDWLEGHTLADEIDLRRRESPRRPYALPEAIALIEPIAIGLDTAHAAGIVHRDVNPRNIFLEKSGETERAKLIDFGFAKDVAQTRNLQLGSVKGTLHARSPDYAAPEHYDREKYGDLSENTDIYTLALTLVEMLTLDSPLRGATPEALALATSNPDDRPTPNNRGANVPHNVELIFREALAVDQFERPGSLLSWFRSLEQAVKRPTVAPPRSSLRPPAKKRRTLGWAIALGLFTLLAAGAVVAFVLTRPLKCPAGYADCNGNRKDGCEVELASSTLHCGGCNNACPTTDGTAICAAGACRIERCNDELARDCNGSSADGCEVNVSRDRDNCGGCGRKCGAEGTTAVACVASRCELSCSKDRGDCDGRAENGCETALSSDAANCGRCGLTCQGTSCEHGFCVAEQLTELSGTYLLSARGGEAWVWSASSQRLVRIVKPGAEQAVEAKLGSPATLLVSTKHVIWLDKAPKPRLLALARDQEGAKPKLIGTPLAGPSELVLSSDGTTLTLADRPARAGKKPALGPKALVAIDLGTEELASRRAECPDYPARFAGDARQLYCCDDTRPLYALTCRGKQCTSRKHPLPCPELMLLDPDSLYFFRGTRLFAMDRITGKARQLVKRMHEPSELAQDATHVYWIEGRDQKTILRLRKPERSASAVEAPEPIAAALNDARDLRLDESALYWTTSAEKAGPRALHRLQKPAAAPEKPDPARNVRE